MIQAAQWFRKAAEQDDSVAQYTLAAMYENGAGVLRDPAQAANWYRRAAEKGHVKAQFDLGVIYASGSGVARDAAQAVLWFRKAADAGEARAQFNLGVMYAAGTGVPQDDRSRGVVPEGGRAGRGQRPGQSRRQIRVRAWNHAGRGTGGALVSP